jgi:hypothetical protein
MEKHPADDSFIKFQKTEDGSKALAAYTKKITELNNRADAACEKADALIKRIHKAIRISDMYLNR